MKRPAKADPIAKVHSWSREKTRYARVNALVIDLFPYWFQSNPCPSLPELGCIGLREVRSAHGSKEHTHVGTFEFILMESGRADWEVGGKHFQTQSGHVLSIRPSERHRGWHDVTQPCRYLWLQLAVPNHSFTKAGAKGTHRYEHRNSGKWFELPEDEGADLLSRLYALPAVVMAGALPIQLVHDLCRSFESKTEQNTLDQRILFLHFLLRLTQSQPVQQETRFHTELMESLVAKLRKNIGKRFSVAEMADLISVSPSYLFRIVKKETGLTPMRYLKQLRIDEACMRLKETTDPVTKIAHSLGYSSSQHFATSFRRMTGKTPTLWRLNSRQASGGGNNVAL